MKEEELSELYLKFPAILKEKLKNIQNRKEC